MYTAALEFLEDERESWRPYEALSGLSDAQLERPTPADGPGHGWSGRRLLSHMIAWREHLLDVARELAVGDRSPAKDRMDADWKARGDAVNDDLFDQWDRLPLDELRARCADVPGELRGTLTVVPEARWLKDSRMQALFLLDTIEHDEEHLAVLECVLAQAVGE